jgi:DNA primase
MSERARLDFNDIKAHVSLEQVMQMLDLRLKKSGSQYRGDCPVHGGNDRTFVVTPNKGFYCFSEKKGGDQIAMYAHCKECTNYDAAVAITAHFRLTNSPAPEVKPNQRQVNSKTTSEPQARDFDPDAFAAKLQYTPEVEALGLSQEDADRIGVGWHPQRKAIYLGFRNPDGSWSGWMKFSEGELVMPPSWISTNVVPMKRRAQQW